MRKLNRRELFRYTGAFVISGGALVVGLNPMPKAVLAGSLVGKSWTPTIYLPTYIPGFGKVPLVNLRLWRKVARDSGYTGEILFGRIRDA